MKKIKISLGTLAFVLGIGAALAFTPATTSDETAKFYLDGSGQPYEEVVGPPDCSLTEDDCHQLWSIDENRQPIAPMAAPDPGTRN